MIFKRPTTDARCQYCGTVLRSTSRTEIDHDQANAAGCLAVIGILLTLTVVGAVIGVPILIYTFVAGPFMVAKKRKLLACRSCGVQVALEPAKA